MSSIVSSPASSSASGRRGSSASARRRASPRKSTSSPSPGARRPHLRQAPHVKAVYDLTIAYQHGDEWHAEPTMWDTLSVPGLSDRLGYHFHVHVRRFPLESLPEKDEDLAKWLEERWVEKGEWLEEKRVEWAATEA
ncbi:Lysocardiolipin acyltransferase 1 like protein [Verticillium longisporum]|nr:Lysocardiolipin acyltransferase 1 like protein [Verticillium longisporum]